MQGLINEFGEFATDSRQGGQLFDRRLPNAGDAAETCDQLLSALPPYSGDFFQMRFATWFGAPGTMSRYGKPVSLVANFKQQLKTSVFERQL